MDTLGRSVVLEACRTASFLFTYSDNGVKKSFKLCAKLSDARDAFAFIQGTALDLVLDSYGLNYSPEEIRRTFYNCLGLRRFFD
jgi:hypothetical protein